MLPNLIVDNKFPFLHGQRISDSNNLAQEFTHVFNNIGTFRRAFVMIDFSNALDSLRWDAIDTILEAFSYDTIFQQLIMCCIKSTSFSALVEGSPTKLFQPQRGVCQGDPLSPLLFIVVIKYLVRLMKKAIADRRLEMYINGGASVELIQNYLLQEI